MVVRILGLTRAEEESPREEDSPDVPLFRRLFRMQSDDNKTAVPNENINGGGLESSPGTEIFFRKLFRDRDRSVEDSELYGSKKNKKKNSTSSKQRTENSNHKPPLPTASQFRKGAYHESLDFVHSLCETSYGLVDVFPVEDRKSALCESLTEINTHVSTAQTSGGMCFPMGKGMYRVVHIPEDEAIVLNSREKAPCLICAEVLKSETMSTVKDGSICQKHSKGGIPLANGDAFLPKPPPWAYPLSNGHDLYHSSYDRMSQSASDAIDQAMGQLWDSKAKFVNVSLVVENQSPRCSNNFETSGRGWEIYFRTKLKHLSCIHTLSTPHKHHQRHLHGGGRQPQSPQQDPYSLLKEDPVQVLSDLWVRTFSDHNQTPFSNLTGFLSKLDLWVLAYQRTCAQFTGSFPSRNAIQSHVLADLLSLRNAVVHGQYQWNMKTQPYIQNPNDKTPFTKLSSRKLRTISHSCETPFQDTVVQELLLMILEPIFEPRFSPKSHAFRPGRNAHTAIRTIRSNFAGYVWFLKGDLTLIFDHVDANLLMGFVEKGFKDQKVLSLIKSGLKDLPKPVHLSNEKVYRRKPKKKGLKKKKVLDENEAKPDPYWLRTFYDFAPMEALKVPNYGFCGILSPLLANICLNELDHMIGEKILRFSDDNFVSISNASINDSYSTTTPSWPEFVRGGGKDKTKKMDYIRYGGHFLIGIRGSRKDAVEIRNAIIKFSTSKYGLTLNESNLHIEHISRGIQFLDHIISQRVIYPKIRFASNGGHIVTQKSIGILLSITASLPQCIRHFRRLKFVKGDKDPDPLPCTPMLYCGQAQTNAQMNKFLETMADWYRYADNRKKIVGFCAYVIRNSVGKLYAARYKMKSRAKVFKKGTRDLSAPLRQCMDNRTPEYADLLRLGLADFIEGIRFSRMCMIPSCDYTPFPRKWVPHHERVLVDYIKLRDLNLFCELQRSVKGQRLRLPQDMLGEIVWDYKTLGARNRCPKFGM